MPANNTPICLRHFMQASKTVKGVVIIMLSNTNPKKGSYCEGEKTTLCSHDTMLCLWEMWWLPVIVQNKHKRWFTGVWNCHLPLPVKQILCFPIFVLFNYEAFCSVHCPLWHTMNISAMLAYFFLIHWKCSCNQYVDSAVTRNCFRAFQPIVLVFQPIASLSLLSNRQLFWAIKKKHILKPTRC